MARMIITEQKELQGWHCRCKQPIRWFRRASGASGPRGTSSRPSLRQPPCCVLGTVPVCRGAPGSLVCQRVCDHPFTYLFFASISHSGFHCLSSRLWLRNHSNKILRKTTYVSVRGNWCSYTMVGMFQPFKRAIWQLVKIFNINPCDPEIVLIGTYIFKHTFIHSPGVFCTLC